MSFLFYSLDKSFVESARIDGFRFFASCWDYILITCIFCVIRCKCEECTVYYLTDAVEYRCCREIAQASQKLMFDGSIERISCITQHEDYSAMTNRSVLSQVAPLLRDRNGRGYRRRDGQTQNQ